MTRPSSKTGSRSWWLILALILVAGAGLRVALSLHHQKVDFDEGRYLDNAVHLLEEGALSTSTLSHFFGDPEPPPRPEDMSSPLYPLVLAGLFSLTGVSFSAAKLLSLLLGIAAIPLVFLVGRAYLSPAAGAVAAAAFALQPDQAIVSVWTMTEALFTLLILGVMLAARPWLAGRESSGRTTLRLLLLAILIGALYLTRQNGASVAVAVALLMLLEPGPARGLRPGSLKQAALLTVAVFLVCLPWFIRNARVFGSPTFSRMQNVAWADHGRSLYTPGVGEPSLSSFRERHGTAGVLGNIKRRVERVSETFLFAEKGPQRILALAAVGSIFVPALFRASLPLMAPALLSAFLLLGVAPWSGALPRYMLPVRALLYIAGAGLLLRAGKWAADRWLGKEGFRTAAAAAASAVALVWAVHAAVPVLSGYLGRDQAAPDALAREAAAWIESNTPESALIMEGAFLHEYAYLFRRGVVWTPFGDLAQALETAGRYGVDYMAVSRDVVRFRPELAGNWSVEGEAIRPVSVPPELEPVLDLADRGLIVYRIRRGNDAQLLE